MAEEMGLLGRIGSGIEGLLGNPVVQGIGAAAATGFNPLLGLLAVPGLRSTRDRRGLENQLLRDQVASRKRQTEAQAQLPALLSDTTPVIGQERFIEGLGGEEIGIPGRMQQVPTASTPQGQQELMGLLAQSNPDGFSQVMTQGLLGQMFPAQSRTPTSIAELDALGLPRTEEGLARLQEIKNRLGPADQANLALANARLESLQRENLQETKQAEAAREQEKFSIKDTLKQGRNILKLTDRLEGTFLEPGRVGSGVRRPLASLAGEVAGLFGNEEFSEQQQQLVDDFDTFKKDSVNFVVAMVDQFGTNPTNFQLETLQRANAGEDVSPAAIKSVVTDVLQRTLNEAEAKGIEVPEREEFEKLLNRFKGGSNRVDLGDGVTLEFVE